MTKDIMFREFIDFYDNTIINILDNWDYIPIQAKRDIKSNIEEGIKLISDYWSRCEYDSIDNQPRLFIRKPQHFEKSFSITKDENVDLLYYIANSGFSFSIEIDYHYEYGGNYIRISWKYPNQKLLYSATNQRNTIKVK